MSAAPGLGVAKRCAGAREFAVSGIVVGIHPVRVLLRRRPAEIERLHVLAVRQDPRVNELRSLASTHGIPIVDLSAEAIAALAHGQKHQGVVAQLREETGQASSGQAQLDSLLTQHRAQGTSSLFLVLDGVQDPHNLGACWRSAGAAGAHALVIPDRRSAPVNATVRKVASGASEFVPCFSVSNLSRALERLAADGVRLIGASACAKQTVYDVNLCEPVAFVVGGESRGLRRLTKEKCDSLVRIPMPGPLESLNVSVAAGVMMFEAVRQRPDFLDRADANPQTGRF